MDPRDDLRLTLTRRHFLGRSGVGLGSLALASLLDERLFAREPDSGAGVPGFPDLAPRAKRVIYLF